MKISGIYIISSISKRDRMYIGSAVNMHKRFSEHLSLLRRNKHHSKLMQRHFNKYGEQDLRTEILQSVPDRSRLLIAEQSFLDMFKPAWNTNRTAGSNLGTKFGPHSEEHKLKISIGNKGKVISESTRELHRVKMSKYNLDGDLIKVYKSGLEAQAIEGYAVKNYSDVNLTMGGFIWVSANYPLPDFDKIKKRLIECRKVLCKPVLQINKDGKLIAEYDGVRIAFKKTGIDHRSIAQVAAGSKIRKTAGGFIWKYKEVQHVT